MRRHLAMVLLVVSVALVLGSCQPAPEVPPANALASVGVEQASHLYCRHVARGTPRLPAVPTPESIRGFWDARRAFEHAALIASPGAISGDWATVAAFTRDVVTPAIDAMGYVAIPVIAEPDAVAEARVRIAIVDAGCDSLSA
jgi:hypothetical protein